jgi:predicted phage terminase large subunit-like protein
MRLYTLTEVGCVLLRRSAPWLVEYVRELTLFPGCKFDDQVDTTSQALEHLKNRGVRIYDVL